MRTLHLHFSFWNMPLVFINFRPLSMSYLSGAAEGKRRELHSAADDCLGIGIYRAEELGDVGGTGEAGKVARFWRIKKTTQGVCWIVLTITCHNPITENLTDN
jgi:hypothetical protein